MNKTNEWHLSNHWSYLNKYRGFWNCHSMKENTFKINFDKNCQRQAAIDQNEYGNERGTAHCTSWHYAGH